MHGPTSINSFLHSPIAPYQTIAANLKTSQVELFRYSLHRDSKCTKALAYATHDQRTIKQRHHPAFSSFPVSLETHLTSDPFRQSPRQSLPSK